jgi:hypothetical protein
LLIKKRIKKNSGYFADVDLECNFINHGERTSACHGICYANVKFLDAEGYSTAVVLMM